MFVKNPFNEYRATQETLEEKLMTSAERAKEMQKQANAAKKKAQSQAAKTGYKTEDEETKNEAMDPVNKKELKGKHKDRKDKDIDNDGDVDSSDKYLHKRRKAISKSNKGSDVEVNPKMDKEQKESRIRSALKSILEGDRAKHYKGAAPAETMDDKIKGKGAKDMAKDHAPKTEKESDFDEKGHDDASKAGKVTKPAKQRSGGDAVRSGDQKIKGVMAAYQKMKGN